jgi:hypothetical protein
MAKGDGKTRTKKGAPAGGEGDPAVIRLWAARGRGAGALVGFSVVAWVSYRAGIDLTDAAFRGLIGAVVFSFVGWLCALLVLTGLLRTAAHDRVHGERKAAETAAAARRQAMAQAVADLRPPASGFGATMPDTTTPPDPGRADPAGAV